MHKEYDLVDLPRIINSTFCLCFLILFCVYSSLALLKEIALIYSMIKLSNKYIIKFLFADSISKRKSTRERVQLCRSTNTSWSLLFIYFSLKLYSSKLKVNINQWINGAPYFLLPFWIVRCHQSMKLLANEMVWSDSQIHQQTYNFNLYMALRDSEIIRESFLFFLQVQLSPKCIKF